MRPFFLFNKLKKKRSKPVGWENNPNYGKTHSDETKKKIMSDAKKGENNPNSSKIEVTDLKEITTTSYNSFREAARALNLPSHKAISNYIKKNKKKPYKGRYTFKKI